MRRLWTVGVVVGLLTGCNGESEAFKRATAEPGQILTVIDDDTPRVPKDGTLQDFAVSPDGTIYMALAGPQGQGPGRIVAVPKAGQPRVLADEKDRPFPEGSEMFPAALAFDSTSGTLYVLDLAEERIRAIDPDGTRRNVAGFAAEDGSGQSTFGRAKWLAVVPDTETFYIADRCQVARVTTKDVIVVAGARAEPCGGPVDPAALFAEDKSALAGETYGDIGGIAVDPETGELLVAVNAEGVFRVTDGGMVAPFALTDSTQEVPQLAGGSIVIDSETKDLYVIETDQDVVLQLFRDGTIKRIAGNGEDPSDGEDDEGGSALEAPLFDPQGLGIDGDGNVYVQDDPRKLRIRMVGA